MINCIGTIALTLGIGVIDHEGWREHFGAGVGSVELTAPVLCSDTRTLQLGAYHLSSVETEKDRGINTLMLEYSMEFGK